MNDRPRRGRGVGEIKISLNCDRKQSKPFFDKGRGAGYAAGKAAEKTLGPAAALGIQGIRTMKATFDEHMSTSNNGISHTKLPKTGGNNEKI